ncbi:MAG TPA: hypothetical protein PKW11_11640 [Pseudomonadota bacterium]|nr:hypothetical protein [Pseudomonadota bacterium]HNI60588.1 hypothetical protein [Pseudomonadota bacterium]
MSRFAKSASRSRVFLGAARALALFCGTLWAGTAAADATTIPCGLVEAGTIHIDGLTSDWDGVTPIIPKVAPATAAAPRTLGVKVYCNYDDTSVYLMVDVDDDLMVRTKGGGPEEDHVQLAFGIVSKAGELERIDRLRIWPGVAAQKLPRIVKWEAKKSPKVIQGEGPVGRLKPLKGPPVMKVYDAMQQRGYVVELKMPKKIIPGYRDGAPLKFAVFVNDSDGSGKEHQSYAATSAVEKDAELSEIGFEEGHSAFTELLHDLKLSDGDVHFNKNANVGEGPGKVVAAGKYLAFLGKGYCYQELAPSRKDVTDVQLVQLDSDTFAVAARVIERNPSGNREVLRLYKLDGQRFVPIFQAEVGKEQGKNKLSVKVDYVKKGKGTDIELAPEPAVGFSEATWRELPAQDIEPLLLPWQDKKARYTLRSGKYEKVEK